MKNYLLEVCCGSVEDVLAAKSGGADRVELNSCLFHGGLTPSIGELITAKKLVDIPVMTMVRPRAGGFLYTDAEFEEKRQQYDYCPPFTKESLLYREIFEKYYPGQARMIKDFWMPNRSWPGCNVDDPSARVLSNYGASGE